MSNEPRYYDELSPEQVFDGDSELYDGIMDIGGTNYNPLIQNSFAMPQPMIYNPYPFPPPPQVYGRGMPPPPMVYGPPVFSRPVPPYGRGMPPPMSPIFQTPQPMDPYIINGQDMDDYQAYRQANQNANRSAPAATKKDRRQEKLYPMNDNPALYRYNQEIPGTFTSAPVNNRSSATTMGAFRYERGPLDLSGRLGNTMGNHVPPITPTPPRASSTGGYYGQNMGMYTAQR